MFFILGISISFFLELLLLLKKNKSKADKILVAWLFLIVIHQVLNYLLLTEAIYAYPYLLAVESPMPVLQGVFLYAYVFTITGNKLKHKATILLHFLTTILTITLLIPFYLESNAHKIYVFQNDGIGYEWFTMFLHVLIPTSGLVYSVWSLILIKKHQEKIVNRFSNTDKKELQWLRYLSLGYVIIWVISIFYGGDVIFIAVTVLVMFIGFFGINQLNIFNSSPVIESENLEENLEEINNSKTENNIKRYSKSGLNEETSLKIYSELSALMEDKEIYKNDNLTLTELAKTLKIHSNHLSQVINEKEGTNFYNYINSLRIKEFIKIASLPQNDKFTKIALAYDCGFNTKSTFNKHFKAFTGKTPTEFFQK